MIGEEMSLSSLLIDGYFSLSEMNGQHAFSKKLGSQKSLGIIQCDHFNGPSVIEPVNFCFVDVSTHNLSVRQNVGFPADSLETQTTNDARRKAQLSRETGVDDNRNLALCREGLQNNDWLPLGAYFSLDGHERRSE